VNGSRDGGSRGIGAAIVETFAFHGAKVAFCHLDDEARIAPPGLFPKMDPAVAQHRCDVAEETPVAALTDWAMEHQTLFEIQTLCTLPCPCPYFDRLKIGNPARHSCILTQI
jgi:3-oxoacyl-[acyl-carrier protein] reductase